MPDVPQGKRLFRGGGGGRIFGFVFSQQKSLREKDERRDVGKLNATQINFCLAGRPRKAWTISGVRAQTRSDSFVSKRALGPIKSQQAKGILAELIRGPAIKKLGVRRTGRGPLDQLPGAPPGKNEEANGNVISKRSDQKKISAANKGCHHFRVRGDFDFSEVGVLGGRVQLGEKEGLLEPVVRRKQI